MRVTVLSEFLNQSEAARDQFSVNFSLWHFKPDHVYLIDVICKLESMIIVLISMFGICTNWFDDKTFLIFLVQLKCLFLHNQMMAIFTFQIFQDLLSVMSCIDLYFFI